MKKTLYVALALALGSVAFTSCEDQLDIPQKGVIDREDFYKTADDAEAALAAAYVGFMENVVGRQPDMGGPGIYTPNKILMNIGGDDLLYASGNYGDHEFSGDVDEFRYDTELETIKFQYSGIYQSIYTCNLVLKYFGDYSGNDTRILRSAAEARVLRAYDYFLLAILWGNAPLVTDVLNAEDAPENCAETPEEGRTLLLKFVADECIKAEPNLVKRSSPSDKEMAVRVSKGFADALAGKAYLYLGDYKNAKTYLKKVITSGSYDLVPGDRWADNFHIEGDANEEKVFEINFEYNAGVGAWGGMIQRSSWMEANAWNWRAGNFVVYPAKVYCGIDGWGGLGVQQWFGDAFFENDGHSARFDESLVSVHDAIFNHYMEYEKPELNSATEAELLASDQVGIKDNVEGLYGNSFWLQKKWLIRRADTDGNKYGDNIRLNNYLIMRYAEVLLNYAEACVMANEPGDAGEALKYVKAIQERAGSKSVSTTSVDMNVIKKERAFELFLENSRWFDVLRWNDSAGIARLEKAGSEVPHVFDKKFRPISASDKGVVEHKDSRLYLVHTHAAKDAGREVGFKKEKHAFFPFPQSAIDKNPSLKQHANW